MATIPCRWSLVFGFLTFVSCNDRSYFVMAVSLKIAWNNKEMSIVCN